MSDPIDRQAAVRALECKKDKNAKGDIAGFYNIIIQNDIDTLMHLPSAQPEPSQVARDIATIIENEQDMMVIERNAQRWIPCSERLPEVGRCVLLSVGGMYAAEGCLREDGDWAQFRWSAIQRKDMIGAWMPLPDPWEGENNGI